MIWMIPSLLYLEYSSKLAKLITSSIFLLNGPISSTRSKKLNSSPILMLLLSFLKLLLIDFSLKPSTASRSGSNLHMTPKKFRSW